MAKYSYELKKKIVDQYLNGNGGFTALTKQYSVPYTVVRRWVHAYTNLGEDGLKRSRSNKEYSFEYKMQVVQLYMTSEMSYLQIAKQEKMNNPSMIANWVTAYRKHGIDGLKSHKKGRKPKPGSPPMNKEHNEEQTTVTADDNVKRIKELEDENYHLRLENAILKKTRRLRLEEEAKSRKRESSTAYDKNSN